MAVKEIFGSNLRNFRKKNKYTQEKLAELVGITPQHLGVIERGEAFISAELLEKFSQILHIPFPTFFYSDTEKFGDESFLKNVDKIIEKELNEVIVKVKKEIRGY